MLVELTSDEQGSPLKTLKCKVPTGYNSWNSSILYADLSAYWNWVKTIGKARDGEHELTVTDEAGNTTSAYVTMGSRLMDCWIDSSFEGIEGGGWGSYTAKGPFLVNGGQGYKQIVFETNDPQPGTETFDLSGSSESESTVVRLGNQ